MNIPTLLGRNYDNFFFNMANEWEERSVMSIDKKEYAKAWGWSLISRLPFLVDVIVSVVAIPLAFIGIFFGIGQSIFTWGKETSFVDYFGHKLVEKVNHLFISIIGATVSPWLANKGKDLYQADNGIIRFQNTSE